MTIYDFSVKDGVLYGNGKEVEFKDNKADLVLDGRLYTLTKYDNPYDKEKFTVGVERTMLSLDEARSLKGSSLLSYTLEASGDNINVKDGLDIPKYDTKQRDDITL